MRERERVREKERLASQLQSSIRRSELKSIVIELYRVNENDYRGSICDTTKGSIGVIVNCVILRASVK